MCSLLLSLAYLKPLAPWTPDDQTNARVTIRWSEWLDLSRLLTPISKNAQQGRTGETMSPSRNIPSAELYCYLPRCRLCRPINWLIWHLCTECETYWHRSFVPYLLACRATFDKLACSQCHRLKDRNINQAGTDSKGPLDLL